MNAIQKITKNNKVILIGCDGVGKTTLAELISKEFDYKYIKASAKDSDNKIEYANKVLDSITDNKVLFDRFYFPDDLIYSKLIAGTENDLVFDDWIPVIKRLNQMGFVIVYLTQDFELIKKRFIERGDEFITVDQLELINSMYTDIMELVKEHATVIHIDLSKEAQ